MVETDGFGGEAGDQPGGDRLFPVQPRARQAVVRQRGFAQRVVGELVVVGGNPAGPVAPAAVQAELAVERIRRESVDVVAEVLEDARIADPVEVRARFPAIEQAPSRSLPIASLDAGLFFDRETRLGGESFLQTLEPRLFYLRVPYRDQDGLPRFDTRPLTFSWGQLFRENRYTGADRQTDANQLTLAVSTRLLRQSDGREKLSASLGQIRYFDESRVTVPGETPVERGKSAWVVDSSYAVNDRWSLGGSYQWDPKFRRKDLASVRTRYLVGDTGVVNLSYRYRRDLLEQVDFNFLYPLSPSWSVVGRYYYSLEDNQLLEGIAGLQWDSCCMAVRLVGRRYLHNREGELNNSIQFEIELKGLGSAGPDTESRLRRAILGYYREDLYLVPPSDDEGEDDASPDLMP